MKRKKLFYILMVVSVCGMAATANGMGNMMGVLYSPLAETFNVGIGKTNIYYTASLLACGLFGPIAVKLEKRFKYRHLITFGVTLSVVSYVLMSRINKLWPLYIL